MLRPEVGVELHVAIGGQTVGGVHEVRSIDAGLDTTAMRLPAISLRSFSSRPSMPSRVVRRSVCTLDGMPEL